MNKGKAAKWEDDEVIDSDDLPRVKVPRKNNANEEIQSVIDGFNELNSHAEKYNRTAEESTSGPRIEILEDEEKLSDDAGIAETTSYKLKQVKNKLKNAWDGISKPFREDSQVKKELADQQKVIRGKVHLLRKKTNRAVALMEMESRMNLEEMERVNSYKEEQYRIKREEKDREIQEKIKKLEAEISEGKKQREKKCSEENIKEALEKEKLNPYVEACQVGTSYGYTSREVPTQSAGLRRFSITNSFQSNVLHRKYQILPETSADVVDVDSDMKTVVSIMQRSKLEKINQLNRIIFLNMDDSFDFCSMFNRVIYPLEIGEYKFSNFTSGGGNTSSYYYLDISDLELEIINSFNTHKVDENINADVAKTDNKELGNSTNDLIKFE